MILKSLLRCSLNNPLLRTYSPHLKRSFQTTWIRDFRGLRNQAAQGNSCGNKNITVNNKVVESNGIKVLTRPFFFTMGISLASFVGCAIWQYESMRIEAQSVIKGWKKSVGNQWKKAGEYRHSLNNLWNSLSPGQKLTTVLISINTIVYLSWRLPALQMTMHKYFLSNPFKAAPCLSMLFSTFSHKSFFHLFANMYVMLSFSSIVIQTLGKEQFLAVFLSAGMFSSLASYALKVFRPSMVPSLGASGAIMAMLAVTCIGHPHAQLAIAFVSDILPHSFSANSAMKGLIAFDSLGLIFGWKLFDHAAHLGGMFFGIWYMMYGRDLIWSRRAEFMKWWHELRSSGDK